MAIGFSRPVCLSWGERWKYVLALTGLVFVLSAACMPQAKASDQFGVLNEAAITVKDPTHVRLISIARAGNRLVAVGEYGVIVYSDDNGSSWHQSSVPVSVTITCIAFANAQSGWAAGDYGVILHTTDGGQSWQTQINGTQVNQLMIAAAQSFSSAHAGTPAADTAMRRANIFLNSGPDKPFLTILATSPTSVAVFGAYRMAVATTDGGAHWQDISLNIGDKISHNIYGVAASASDVYLAEESGLVLHSSDGGNNFAPLTQPVEATLFGVVLPGNKIIIVYGVAGSIYRSADGGTTWSQVNLGTDANLTTARSLQEGREIIIGTQRGFIYMSSDGGVTFTKLPVNVGMELYDFEQAANGDIICVGDTGIRVIDHLGQTLSSPN